MPTASIKPPKSSRLLAVLWTLGLAVLSHGAAGSEPPADSAAAGGAGDPAKPAPTVSLTFTSYAAFDGKPPELWLVDGDGNPAAIHFRPYRRSFPQHYRGPTVIPFFPGPVPSGKVNLASGVFRGDSSATDRHADGAGLPLPAPVAVVTLEPTAADVLLIFARRDAPGTFNVFPMADDPSAFPPSTAMFFNATAATLEGRFGEHRIRLTPGLNGPFDVSDRPEEPRFIGLGILVGEVPRAVLQNRWRFTPQHRDLFLLLPPEQPEGTRLRAYRLNQDLSPPAPEAPQESDDDTNENPEKAPLSDSLAAE